MWIAFNFVSLQCETQLGNLVKFPLARCELLSILYLCSVKHNSPDKTRNIVDVVNCFQFCIFAVWNTTPPFATSSRLSLWIAFNFVSLQCETQPSTIVKNIATRCELLSILYLCSVKHNRKFPRTSQKLVVNCFQFCIFAVWNTTSLLVSNSPTCCELLSILYLCSVKHNMAKRVITKEELWIAFNFVSLQCETQHTLISSKWKGCCELLSILYLCSVKHNNKRLTRLPWEVVNCFQFCIFAVWNTTRAEIFSVPDWLWIAFNFVSLQCETQHSVNCLH